MKRYKVIPKLTRNLRPDRFDIEATFETMIEEHPEGNWVRWSEVEKLREELENQIPEKRISRLEKQLALVAEGRCPECGEKVHDYKAPFGSFAPEAWATLRDAGIDPGSGHRQGCRRSR